MAKLSSQEKLELREKCLKYVEENFLLQDTVDKWHDTMKNLAENWKESYKTWECFTL